MDMPPDANDPRPGSKAVSILAKSMYRELTTGGYRETDVIDFAGELLRLLAFEIVRRRAVL